ncbi:glycine cleavage system aminomethyltransferase GcvT [Owenweeksia hongkongensis]|uniref:Aminomethyltransferase n=1 Tax=Owenweeksia hongkongensis (strain DSM 17368 / CIP 108786 / JCM 12287 / NRRL B-23963 / UST20020801) TaxID=926562 RepID=G8R3Z3_OWEHD|nr:glycine cleavage system aminomethyltransferase GcvT [Owenweeksia hongkongensis]AEV32025.1 glycine cleavage system T protein [Owenweeksia hongkongensis DSM 17368]
MKNIELNDLHIELGAKMVPFAGYNMPLQYEGLNVEHLHVRSKVGIFDVSHMGEFFVSGDGALDFLQKVTTNDVSKLTDGKVQYSCMPNDKGGIVDDLLVYRISEKEYMLVVNASNIEKDWNWLSSHNDTGALMVDESDDYSLFAVQGPEAVKALQSLTEINLEEMVYYTFDRGTFAGVDNVFVSATGYTGSGGFEIYVKNKDAKKVWDKIMEAGAEHDIKPIGLAARDTLRLEKGFCLYGNDIDDTTSPIEAGLGWITKFTKDFIGSEGFKKQKEEGASKRLVGFEMIDRGIPRKDYAIKNEGGEVIGRVTSGTQAPSLGQAIGIGYVDTAYKAADTEIYIDIRNKMVKAKVVKMPFVK